MKKVKVILFLALVTIISGCSDPKIDATSEDTMKSSSQKVRESLSKEQQVEFDKAIETLAFSQIDIKSLLSQGAMGTNNIENKMKEALHGKTGTQIITEANRVLAERKEREKQQAIKEIKELEEKKKKQKVLEKALKILKLFDRDFINKNKNI